MPTLLTYLKVFCCNNPSQTTPTNVALSSPTGSKVQHDLSNTQTSNSTSTIFCIAQWYCLCWFTQLTSWSCRSSQALLPLVLSWTFILCPGWRTCPLFQCLERSWFCRWLWSCCRSDSCRASSLLGQESQCLTLHKFCSRKAWPQP